ncbi:uncharacterized protein LOC127251624 [Andrographis paniculata]|uniref:uncharacterized protein LOC127251624 n=1 Tax=Andrographis paniculata TaxID=175694 RepID=UPI0021E738E3|nr:uncharacterized protein LOC127251624 [Andrographis paniculata]
MSRKSSKFALRAAAAGALPLRCSASEQIFLSENPKLLSLQVLSDSHGSSLPTAHSENSNCGSDQRRDRFSRRFQSAIRGGGSQAVPMTRTGQRRSTVAATAVLPATGSSSDDKLDFEQPRFFSDLSQSFIG